MANNSEKEYWTLRGDKIIIKGKSYSIFYVTVLSLVVKVVSIALLAYSFITFLTLQQTGSIAAMGLAILTFLFGYIFGKIAKKANDMYLDDLDIKIAKSHKDLIKRIKAGEEI